MERKVIVICSIVGFLGLSSAALGFAAEAKRIKDEAIVNLPPIEGSQVQLTSPSTCTYPISPAFGLGLTAAVALMVAQIIINVTTGCICCRRGPHQSNSNWTLALVCFVVSWKGDEALEREQEKRKQPAVERRWFTFVIAFLLLLTGAALNAQHGEVTMYFGNYYNYDCYVVKPGVFAGAAILSLASVILGLVYYLALNPVKNSNASWGGAAPSNQGSIAMGQAQCPPPNTQAPVFVHEDTYMRRQFT
ncbi:transmembrane protein, putative [Actinidia rufa]|uniref:Transmembrane protein, putative n=1 Tax=Actinidia rufa TaxID=165716 RepID=A0A7J0EA88_9ERIC|nr:transmembrane protein, putative [Actinidia rufa]